MTRPTAYTDRDIFDRIAQDDEHAFEMLFVSYAPELKPVIFQIIKNESVVNDIIQDVFLGLWLDRHRLDEVNEPRKWIFKMMYNRCFRWLERRLLQSKMQQTLDSLDNYSNLNDSLNQITLAETSALIQKAVNQLGPRAREIYLFKREHEYKISEIAELLGISQQSVKNSLSRSTNAIKEYLASNDIIIPAALLFFCDFF